MEAVLKNEYIGEGFFCVYHEKSQTDVIIPRSPVKFVDQIPKIQTGTGFIQFSLGKVNFSKFSSKINLTNLLI